MPKELRSAMFEPDVIAKIQAIADDEGRTWSDVLRRLADEALTARRSAGEGEAAPQPDH